MHLMMQLSLSLSLSLSPRYSLFSPMPDEEMEDFNPLATINWFIKFVDYLILVALEVCK